MNKRLLFPVLLFQLVLGIPVQAQSVRDYISMAGSSTVYPFATTVAERFGKAGKFKTPKVESTGTGGGFKLFCGGVGPQYPDISTASRTIKASEREACSKAGVKDIVEVKIGYDGIAVANSKKGPAFKLSRKDLYLALAKQVPDPRNPQALVANPYKSWNQINKDLPAEKIEVLGPPPTSGTRDAFVELVMQAGCSSYVWIKALKEADEGRFNKICNSVREDGGYVDAGENDNLVVQKLQSNPKALGIFGFSYLEENLGKVQGSIVDGVAPTFENIASGAYPISRPLFLYVKLAHVGVIPGIQEFINEFMSDRAVGGEGYLADKGLVPMPGAEVAKVRRSVANLKR